MHDPEFEKAVQKRMEELEFTPSEGVWINLERGLDKEERRRAPLFWLFFLLGGILLGAGGASLFYFHRSPSTIPGTGASAKTESTSPTISPENTVATTAVEHSATIGKTIIGGSRVNDDGSPDNGFPAVARSVTRRAETRSVARTAERSTPARAGMTPEPGRAGQEPPAARLVSLNPGLLSLHRDLSGEISFQQGRNLSNTKYMIGLKAASPALTMNKRAAKKARFSTHPSWEAGFAGGGGLSSAMIPGSSVTADLPPTAFTLASSLQSLAGPGGHLELRISKIQPDLSFWAGIFLQRPVMKRLTFTAGLNLHYYSTRLQTIAQKSSLSSQNLTTPAISYFNSSPYVQPASPYAPDGYKFSNHYYFLQLPVSLQWQVNRSRKTPIFWEGGLALSRLISANALYYNEKSGQYYKDGGAANPNHLMAFSSVMIGLSLRGNSIKIGPEGQYGLTSLINTGNVGSQHLFYGGIKITVIPRKW